MEIKKGLILFFILAIILGFIPSIDSVQKEKDDDSKLVLFYSKTCPHCKEETRWLETIGEKYPNLIIEKYDVSLNRDIFERMCVEYDTIPTSVPMTFVDDKVFIGFTMSDGDLVYSPGHRAYIGYRNQIENAIIGCLNNSDSCPLITEEAIKISKNDPLVKELIDKNPGCISNAVLINDSYLVAWWTPERIRSNLYYPDVLVYVDVKTGEILKSEIPSEPVEDLEKPIQGMNWIHASILSVILIYLLLYLLLQWKLKWNARYWAGGFIAILIISLFVLAVSTPPEMIEKFARNFPFPVFVFIIALVDGFNPCAFTVLIILLSLLTHTRSRAQMGLVGSIFILVSGVMYFIFIMLLILAISWLVAMAGKYESILWIFIGLVVLVAGIINVKDFFFFKKGISLGISEEHRGRISREAGRIVRNVRDAKTKKTLALAIIGVVVLAVFVNMVEFGCTAILPMAYTAVLKNKCMAKYGEEEITISSKCFPIAVMCTAFYSLVYIIPLLAILGNFIYSFKSTRLSERQARILKLVVGIIMVILGAILILKPELLIFG